MPRKTSQPNEAKFHRLLGEGLQKVFLQATGGEQELCDEAMFRYAREHVGPSEVDELLRIQEREPEVFMQMISNMASSGPDYLARFLDITAEVYASFKRLEQEGPKSGSPERE